ncbi:heterokaryon incompatibility protein-domain-containing protein [Cubamyces lactineus]|nr:heterokaryon incompatibility protein-domain-containing protein [Cubamyces lactineus]
MWLLSTTKVQLRFFNGLHELDEGSAILSHVWHSSEQSFQEIQKLQLEDATYDDPRICEKIRGCVRTAKALGYTWVWIDTCCIDKTSSAELEEAINSMFRWYTEAKICLAYLADVPDDCLQPQMPHSAFRLSKWFTRGWTLQELIAPRNLVFMSTDWTYLGAKLSLADLLEEITGVEEKVLTFRLHLSEIPISRRMSWASSRSTSRVEDEAYSLMGIFEITMPTIYGEGRVAFRRLQEEIMRRSSDCTLFVWGDILPACKNGESVRPLNLTPPSRESDRANRAQTKSHKLLRDRRHVASALLATAPSAFRNAPYVTRAPLALPDMPLRCIKIGSTGSDEESTTIGEGIITGIGVRIRLVVVRGGAFHLALLPCTNRAGMYIGIPLWKAEELAQCDQVASGFYTGLSILNSHTRTPSTWMDPPRIKHFRVVEVCEESIRALEAFGWEPRLHPQPGRLLIGGLEILHIRHVVDTTPPKPWELPPEAYAAGPQGIIIPAWILSYLSRHGFEWAAPHTKHSMVLGRLIYPPQDLRFFRQTGSLMLTISIRSCRYRRSCATVELSLSHLTVSTAELPDPNVISRANAQQSTTTAAATIPTTPRVRLTERRSKQCSCFGSHVEHWIDGVVTARHQNWTAQACASRWPRHDSNSFYIGIRLIKSLCDEVPFNKSPSTQGLSQMSAGHGRDATTPGNSRSARAITPLNLPRPRSKSL